MKCPFRRLSRTLQHEIRPTRCSGYRSVQRNGHFAGITGRYDMKSALQSVLDVQASGEMARTAVFTDATTRNRAYNMFWLSKRPAKWPAPQFLRTLRHEIGPTECSGCPSVRRNGPHRCFHGRYDTKAGLQCVLDVQASRKMVRTAVFADATTRNRDYRVFWLSKRPAKWPAPLFSRTLRHEIDPTACSG